MAPVLVTTESLSDWRSGVTSSSSMVADRSRVEWFLGEHLSQEAISGLCREDNEAIHAR